MQQLRILADDPDEFQFNGLGGPSQLVDEETPINIYNLNLIPFTVESCLSSICSLFLIAISLILIHIFLTVAEVKSILTVGDNDIDQHILPTYCM